MNRLQRDLGPVGLLFVSLGGVIGSGWLFAALYAAQIAGPAAIVSWLIGGLIAVRTLRREVSLLTGRSSRAASA